MGQYYEYVGYMISEDLFLGWRGMPCHMYGIPRQPNNNLKCQSFADVIDTNVNFKIIRYLLLFMGNMQ